MNYLEYIVSAQKYHLARGVTSVCSAHPFVLEAALRHGLETTPNTPVLIEATCNQVNQFGGYTGMKPKDFARFVIEIADQVDFPRQNVMLGGDHLGTLVWANEPAKDAMEKAKNLVSEYVRAGFTKIHLDCSTPCADDQELPVEIIAQRTAELAAVAEAVCAKAGLPLPRYIIGSEVPPPGGAKAGEDQLSISKPADAAETIDLTQRAFAGLNLDSAWGRVIALVVQPGVEYGDESVHEYDRPAAVRLARFIESVPGLVYEAHSSDYQTRSALRALVEDHFGILKVGPALTFAFREAVFALADIEEILVDGEISHLREILDRRMQANPAYWQKHYSGSPQQQRFSRFYSFSDRIRYYWSDPEVHNAFEMLMKNLGETRLPLSLISQYMPRQYEKIRDRRLRNHPKALLLDRVGEVLSDYAFACGLEPT